ncbi:hypothetical protein HU200_046353 [Digitaria exilis]|uniref:Uncharacterized protein n=1 Tax=Digitaria exilis TaxID=1010633 RepID=A0A835B4I4_9POAL|nr:hypothetical protein HU200_046353 [Digitaria exilis]
MPASMNTQISCSLVPGHLQIYRSSSVVAGLDTTTLSLASSCVPDQKPEIASPAPANMSSPVASYDANVLLAAVAALSAAVAFVAALHLYARCLRRRRVALAEANPCVLVHHRPRSWPNRV